MDVIRELQKQLQAAQAVSNTKKISERNCVDLLSKLIETDQVRLIHTASGKEWLTPEQLDREIRDVLSANGGRLSITELPNELGVAIEHCENRADLICRRDGAITRMHGELLSTQYVLNVAQEIEESLEEAGCIQVSDLATRYNLPADYVREAVLEKVATEHVVKQNSIYTGAHAARVEARVRGAIRGCTQPVPLSTLASRHGFADVDMVATLVQKAIREGHVLGKLQGATFTPKVHADAQASRVEEFFAANQYLTLSLAKSSGVVVKDWALAKGVDGITLSTAFVALPLVDSALASINEAMSSESWLDVQPVLPPGLTGADARELLQQLDNKKKLPPNVAIMGQVVMSRQLIKTISAGFAAEAKAAAEQKLSAPVASAKPGGKKTAPADDEDDDDWGGGSKKKGKRAAKGKKAGRGGGDDDDGREGASGGGSGTADSGIDNAIISDALAEQFPDIPPDIYDDVCDQVQPLLAAAVNEELAALRATLQTKKKSKFEQAEKLLQEQYERLVLGSRALEATKLQESPLQQHLLREAVVEPLNVLLALRWEEVSGSSVEVTAATRKGVLDKIVAKDGANKAESLSRLLGVFSKGGKDAKDTKETKEAAKNAKTSKDKGSKKKRSKGDDDDDEDEAEEPTDITEIFHAAANDCHIYCRKVDKKREKVVLQEQRTVCREKLRETPASDLAQALLLGLQLALMQDGVVGLLFPAEPWAFRLVASCSADEALQEEALALIDAVDKKASGDGSAEADVGGGLVGDPVALEAAANAWREKFLSASK